ncbi:DNA cytosine methyltransferase [Paenibacillus sp. P32E]|uniref:DNA cytosine methyltransferase n=1 Tax=Paenibacillus sp. P32E TaxID=1349434 RepID=UPI00116142C9|nr:DNA cytosine methyltransferase [Paenibacillus sp. P32E]
MKMPNAAVIDLFCGVGGLTHGLELSGLNVVAGFDIEESCRFAYEKNNSALFINEDINTLTGADINRLYPTESLRILVGCAPCQPFSKYTKRYRKEGPVDDKWKLLYSFARIIKEARPEIVSMENVPELSREEVFVDFINILEKLNYKVSWGIVNATNYGVPQYRKRLVLLASNLAKIDLIPPTHDETNFVTVREALSGLPTLTDGEIDPNDVTHQASSLSSLNRQRIRQSMPGGTWRDWDESLQLECHKKKTGRSYPSVYGRMSWDLPSPTITTQFYGLGNGRFGHPEQHRALSLREGAILQSFPGKYQFIAPEKPFNKRILGTHIGNAVPVELGRAIGISIIKHLKEVKA